MSPERTYLLIGIILLVVLSATVSAEPKKLILLTSPEVTEIELSESGSLEIDAASGDIVVTPADPGACSEPEPVESCEGVQVETTAFSANRNQVPQGDSIVFSWNSRGAWYCAASGFDPWTNATRLPRHGGLSIATDNLTVGFHTAVLLCYNGSVDGNSLSFDFEVTEADDGSETETPPAECDGRTLPSTWTRLSTGGQTCKYNFHGSGSVGWDTSADCRFFNQVFPFDWPGDSFQIVVANRGISNGYEYIAMEFNSGNIPPDIKRQMNTSEPQAGGLQLRKKIWSASKCPGDFNKKALDDEMGPGCYQKDMWSALEPFNWGGTDFVSDANRCALESNQTYYLNLIFSDDPAGTSIDELAPDPFCADGGCGVRLAPSN